MILCFSGTGNSLMVARRLSERLGLDIVDIATLQPGEVDLRNCPKIVWVLPIHSWGMPKFVKRFIQSAEFTNAANSRHYLVCTCGDDIGLAHKQWRNILRRKGLSTGSAHSVFMPNTYVMLPGFDVDTPIVAQNKLDAMPGKVDSIAHAIKCSSPIDNVHRGRFAWLKTRIIYPLFMRFLTSPAPFRASDRCIGCKKCEAACPLRNIKIDSNTQRPSWSTNCTLCLACYHVCPRHAVDYGKASRNKGQYYSQPSL